jgi:hypothetical protein
MKRAELKSILKECLEELFAESDFFMRLMSESIQATISATMRESMAHMPRQVVEGKSSGTPKKKFVDEKGKFDPRAFLTSGAVEDFGNELSNIIKDEKVGATEHIRKAAVIDQKVPDEAVFGEDMGEFFSKVNQLYKGGKR